jgi:hypothetical protein
LAFSLMTSAPSPPRTEVIEGIERRQSHPRPPLLFGGRSPSVRRCLFSIFSLMRRSPSSPEHSDRRVQTHCRDIHAWLSSATTDREVGAGLVSAPATLTRSTAGDWPAEIGPHYAIGVSSRPHCELGRKIYGKRPTTPSFIREIMTMPWEGHQCGVLQGDSSPEAVCSSPFARTSRKWEWTWIWITSSFSQFTTTRIDIGLSERL